MKRALPTRVVYLLAVILLGAAFWTIYNTFPDGGTLEYEAAVGLNYYYLAAGANLGRPPADEQEARHFLPKWLAIEMERYMDRARTRWGLSGVSFTQNARGWVSHFRFTRPPSVVDLPYNWRIPRFTDNPYLKPEWMPGAKKGPPLETPEVGKR